MLYAKAFLPYPSLFDSFSVDKDIEIKQVSYKVVPYSKYLMYI